MPRIAIAGFQHETNSFGTVSAGLEQFEMADSWPGLTTGSALLEVTRGMNLPIAGFAAEAEAAGVTLIPILWAAAEPSAPVTDHAFEVITGRILDGIAAAMPLDGLYLDLHGAMITDSHEDGEAEILRRIRARVGPALPIAISLDLHANVSRQMVALADDICIFKTYPHLDMAATGRRSWHRLHRMLEQEHRPVAAFRQADFLVPLHAQHTGVDPASGLYSALVDDDAGHVELALGFTSGDTPDCGIAVVSYAETARAAEALADDMLRRVQAAEDAFDRDLLTPDEAVARALANPSSKPVILADVQDNPGAGASSDTTGLLRALIDARATGVLLGLMHDPALAHQAHLAGVGAAFSGTMGGRSGLPGEHPLQGRFEVTALSDGHCRYTGEMYGGGTATLGPSCALRLLDVPGDIQVVVTSIRNQCLDLAQFTHFGLSPQTARIVCVKSTAHFRADFDPIAAATLCVAAPGLFQCQLDKLEFQRLRPSVRR